MDKPNLEELKAFVKVYPFPTDILVETTAYCNLQCIMCPQHSLQRPRGEMSWELWKNIVDEVALKSPQTKLWPALMGEALLLGAKVFRMIRYAKERGIKYIVLNSNLLPFRESMADALFGSGLDELIVGIDGHTNATYQRIRVRGDLSKLLAKLDFIINEREKRGLSHPMITLQYIVMEENEVEEEAFIEYWKHSGKKVRLKIKPRTGWSDGVKPWHKNINVSQKDRFLPCTWLLRQMTIFWNGQVPQCDGDYNGLTNYGTVSGQGIEEIWMKLKKIRDKHMRLEFDFYPCNKCEDWQAGRSTLINCGS